MGSILSRPICQVVGSLYPSYASFKALKSDSKTDDKEWLTYWIVYAVFSVTEFWSDKLVSWFPFYWEAKIAFTVWLQFGGSNWIYDKYLQPVLTRHEKTIDGSLSAATNYVVHEGTKIANKAQKKATDYVVQKTMDSLKNQSKAISDSAQKQAEDYLTQRAQAVAQQQQQQESTGSQNTQQAELD